MIEEKDIKVGLVFRFKTGLDEPEYKVVDALYDGSCYLCVKKGGCETFGIDAKTLMEFGEKCCEETCVGDIDRHKRILDGLHDTYKQKDHDYGGAFSEMYDELGFDYGYGKIREKVNRIKTLKDIEAKVTDEPLEDALLDCANYCILTLMEYQKRKEDGNKE